MTTSEISNKKGMLLLPDDPFPNFYCQTTMGDFNFHDYIKNSFCLLMTHPCDFTPVCTTELAKAAKLYPEFKKRGVKLVALSLGPLENHKQWIKDIMAMGNITEFPFPIIADPNRDISVLLGMLRPEDKNKEKVPPSCRKMFLIGPDARLKLATTYPSNVGRSFDEITRAVDAMQVAIKHPVEMPVDWHPGDKCMSIPTLSPEEIKKQLPQGVNDMNLPSGKNYMRMTQV